MVAQERCADLLRSDGKVCGRAGKGIGGVGLVVRLCEGGGCDATDSRDRASSGRVHEVEGNCLVPKHGRRKVGVRGGGIKSRGVIQDREGAGVDGGSVVGGASVVLDAMTNSKIFEGEVCSRRGEVGCWESLVKCVEWKKRKRRNHLQPVLGREGVVVEGRLHLDAGAASAVATTEATDIICEKRMLTACSCDTKV